LVAERLLIDDYAGRVAASRFGLNLTGILGVLLVAKNAIALGKRNAIAKHCCFQQIAFQTSLA
jgi:predicted nucleic acid-binding protein